MKFAKDMSSGKKIQAAPKAKGTCICCETEMVPKCGEIRLHHWAHKNLQQCDHWWENESQWHREWKDRFPLEWQEVLKYDTETGEKHIADIYNPVKDLVIEFQNSPIKGTEIQSREKYYKRMMWLLNGASLNFATTAMDTKPGFFADLEKQINAKASRLYNKEMIEIEAKSYLLRQKSELIYNQLIHNKLTKIEWLQQKNEIDSERTVLIENHELIKKKAKDELMSCKKYSLKNSERSHDQRYVMYNWKYKNKNWNDAASPTFVDFQNELFLLKTEYVAMAVTLNSFLGKYSSK